MRQLPRALSAAVLLIGVVVLASVASRKIVVPAPEASSSTQGGNVAASREDPRARKREVALRRIAESNTYVGAMLGDQDSVLRRWPERMTRPLKIYLPAGDHVPDWTDGMRAAVQAAFFRWERVADVPMRFEFVHDTTGTDVQVRWIREFRGPRTGQADIVWSREGWIVRATLTMAVHSPNGRRLPEEAVHTVALHEIGHLLGLGHSDDAGDVMHATTDIRDLTVRDRNSARLLYGLEPGSLKGQ